MESYDSHDELAVHLDQEMDRFSFTVLQLASSQKAIERSFSDEMLIARHDLVKCYALAFEVVSRVLQQLQESKRMEGLLAARTIQWDSLGEFQRQYERFESLMRIARLQELSSADRASKMQHEVMNKTRSEVRESFKALDAAMQRRFTGLEDRVASFRDEMPRIIREEMCKLFVGKTENASG